MERGILDQLYDGSPESRRPVSFFTEDDTAVAQEEKAAADIAEEAGRLLSQRSYQELDAFARRLRASKERLPGGRWKLSALHSGLVDDVSTADDQAYQIRMAAIEQWIQASPESVTARVALAGVYKEWAWKARGR